MKKLFRTMTAAFVSLSFLSSSAFAGPIVPVRKPLQFVLIAFDGSEVIDRWKDTRQFAKDNDIKFTYFVSGVVFIGRTHPPGNTQSEDMIYAYQGPHKNPGQSDIGFSQYLQGNTTSNQPVIAQRIEQMNLAQSEGHELGSHANGHFEGSQWSQADWDQEFNDFNKLLFDPIYTGTSGQSHFDRSPYFKNANYDRKKFVGFRTPYLSQNSNLYPVLQKYGYTYDTSKTAEPSYWPEKNAKTGLWNFPLAELSMANAKDGQQSKTLSMDYNFYVSQQEQSHRNDPIDNTDPDQLSFLNQQMLETYRAYFKENYEGNRAPVSIGHHFALWNKGIYWKALKDFAGEVCHLKDVRCITYSDLVDFMEGLSPEEREAYKQGLWNDEAPVLSGLPKNFLKLSKGKRATADINNSFEDEIGDAKRILETNPNLTSFEVSQLQQFIKRWEKFDDSHSNRSKARISKKELDVNHWLAKVERRSKLRNRGFDKTYEQLRAENLGHVPSRANQCEGGGPECDGK